MKRGEAEFAPVEMSQTKRVTEAESAPVEVSQTKRGEAEFAPVEMSQTKKVKPAQGADHPRSMQAGNCSSLTGMLEQAVRPENAFGTHQTVDTLNSKLAEGSDYP